MFSKPVLGLHRQVYWRSQIPILSIINSIHQPTCPALSSKAGEFAAPKRQEKSGKCRMGFLPDEWFTFFHVKTGVSGGYLFWLNLVNYCFSKEIYVMEHEYYCGLSIALIVYLVTTRAGPGIGASLDKEVDAIVSSYEVGRKTEIAMYNQMINDAKLAQKRAEGQKMLMDAKKENVLMQLEAIYRERAMHVYKTVRGRLDYHVKLYQAESRIHQKWMSGWILREVMKSITPDFEKLALDQAIKDIERIASRA